LRRPSSIREPCAALVQRQKLAFAFACEVEPATSQSNLSIVLVGINTFSYTENHWQLIPTASGASSGHISLRARTSKKFSVTVVVDRYFHARDHQQPNGGG